LRQPVRFSEGIQTIWAEAGRILLEIGPGSTLTTLAKQHVERGMSRTALPSIRHPQESQGDLPFALTTLGRLWLAGANIDARTFFANERRQRVELPTYPFEREKYWIEVRAQAAPTPQGVSKKPDVSEWFYIPIWKSSLPPAGLPRDGSADAWLLFADKHGFGEKLATGLRKQGDRAIVVRSGRAFSGNPQDGFSIDPTSRADYERLLEEIQDAGHTVGRIVHGWSVGAGGASELSLESAGQAGEMYYSLLSLAQAIGARHWNQPLQIKLITSQVHEVLRGDEVHPEGAMLLALAKVIPQEYHNIGCSNIDIDGADSLTWRDPVAVDQLLFELRTNVPGAVVAYRRGQRWVQAFEPTRLSVPSEKPVRLRDKGAYLITGGLGGVTFILAAYLAQTVKAKLILTGRSTLPERNKWAAILAGHEESDPTSLKIRRVQALEKLGAEVLLVPADTGSLPQMQNAISEAERRFGPIRGVIHGAGVVAGGTFRPVQQISQTECEEQFHPKVKGLIVLERALEDRDLDFCLLTSSLSSVLGGFAYAAYAAANAFMDAYTHYHNQRHPVRWITVNWDEWRLTEEPAEPTTAWGLAQLAMLPSEGTSAFARILELSGASQVVVSTGDLQARIDQWVKLESLHRSKEAREEKAQTPLHPRPNLQSAYVAPGTPTEQKVAKVWQEFLGIEKVGIHDNFFELGGQSLLAIQVVTEIRTELNVEISVATLFEGPTVESLSRIIGSDGEQSSFDQSSERGRKRKEERQRQHVERSEGRP
jgi:acyl transferase domain-containing protein